MCCLTIEKTLVVFVAVAVSRKVGNVKMQM